MDNRHLDFNAFVAQRAQEIASFTTILEADTRKRGHQSLPKSIRRRAMSHNRFRVPLRMRQPIENELIKSQMMQKVPKCRKSIRKCSRLLVSYKQRSGAIKWLSTHMWSVKRMEMVSYWGYKIAFKPKDKSFRSAYRNFRHNACLMDYSYLECLVVQVLDENLFKGITFLGSSSKGSFLNAELSHPDGRTICPASIFQASDLQYYCFFDPSCHEEIQNAAWSGAQVQIKQNFVQFYVLLGPLALQRTETALTQIQALPAEKTEELRSLSMSPGKAIFISASSCPGQCPTISKPHLHQVSLRYLPEINKRLRQAFLSNLRLKNEGEDGRQRKQFWSFISDQAERYEKVPTSFSHTHHPTNRSRFTHKRKVKTIGGTPNKKTIPAESVVLEKHLPVQMRQQMKEPLKFQHKAQQFEDKVSENGSPSKAGPKALSSHGPFLISFFQQKDSHGLLKGCIVLGAKGNSSFWKTLAKLNLKVIGQREYLHCLLESGLPAFPNDYVETKSFESYSLGRQASERTKSERRPKQKRVNFQKMNSPSPFGFVLPGLKCTVICLTMVSAGRCFPGSYICRPEPADLQAIEKKLSQSSFLKAVFCENQTSDKQEATLYEGGVRRQIIGRVTSGGFLFSKCREGGMGYVTGSYLEGEGGQCGYVLVRKVSSRYYFLASIQAYRKS